MTLPTPDFWARKIPRQDFAKWREEIEQNSSLDANDRMWQLRALMAHDVTHGRDDLAAAAARAKARFFIVVAARDHLVNPTPALQWAVLVGARTFVSPGDCGHRMLLPECDGAVVGAAVRKFLDEK